MTDENEPLRVVDRRWWARGDADQPSDDPGNGRKPTVVEELEQQLANKTAQLQEYLGEHRRTLEEFDAAKMRIRRDVAKDVERGKRAVLAELLEVLDNLDRAIAAGRDRADSASDGALLQGVQLVRDQFLAKLEGLGVVRFEALGTPFDAVVHEAVSVQPVTDPAQNGVVVAVAREGYRIGEYLLRPASVVVGTLQ